MATVAEGATEVLILDIRLPRTPVSRLNNNRYNGDVMTMILPVAGQCMVTL